MRVKQTCVFFYYTHCVKGVENTVIQEFEQLLATDAYGDLDKTRQNLLRKANEDKLQREAEIERDYKLCQLIQFGLTLPRESPAYGISKGACNWYRRKYPQDDSLKKSIRKMAWAIDHDLREGSGKHDKHEGHTETAGTGSGDNGTCEGVPTEVHEGIPGTEQGQSQEMESKLLGEEKPT